MFCAQLKTAREKSGVSLEQIAASTKISRSLFSGLERNDLSRWPKGLYRRSYVRAYLTAIDLSPESMVAEFVRLFPDEDAAPGARGEPPDEAGGLSMTLAEGQAEAVAKVRKRIIAAAIDAGIVCLLWAVAVWVTQAGIQAMAVTVTFGYYSIATMALGRSVGCQWLENRHWKRAMRMRPLSASPDTLRGRLDSIKGLADPPDGGLAEDLLGDDEGTPVFDLLRVPNSPGHG